MTDQDDPFTGEDWIEFADDVLDRMVPMMRDSAVVVSVVTNRPDVKFAVELGFSILLDKPIIIVVEPGSKVPSKLVAVADAIVEGKPGDGDFNDRMNNAVRHVLAKIGERHDN